ncbi:MAG: 50S ribosomal protein L10, partial [Myxococcota bacterium]
MMRSDKQDTIERIRDRFGRMTSAVLVDYKGLDVATVTQLRDDLRQADVEYQVVKNTLTRLAIKDEPYAGDLDAALTGMTAIAWSFEEPAAAAKVFKKFRKDHEDFVIKAGVIDGNVIDGDAVVNQL